MASRKSAPFGFLDSSSGSISSISTGDIGNLEMADLSFDSQNSSRLERKMNIDYELKRCEDSLLEAQETNVKCQEAHETIERVLHSNGTKGGDIFTSTRGRWSSPRPKTAPAEVDKRVNDNLPLDDDDEFDLDTKKTTLHGAAICGDTILMGQLLKVGARVNSQDSNGKIPLHYAAEYGQLPALRVLLKSGSIVNMIDNRIKAPLFYAVEHGYVAAAKELIDRGASVNCADKRKKMPLHCASEDGRKMMVDLLLRTGASVYSMDSDMKAPIHYAVEKNYLQITQSLVMHGAPVNQSDGKQRKPLHYAAELGYISIIDFLVQRGATLDALDCNLRTPMFLAIDHGHDFIVHALMNYGASVKTADRNRQTPLHVAACKGFVATANDLIKKGSRLDVQDDEGKSPLFYAVEQREISMVDTLLKCGASVDMIDNSAKSPLHYAAETKDTDLMYLLAQHELKSSKTKNVYRRILEVAIRYNNDYLGQVVWNRLLDKYTDAIIASDRTYPYDFESRETTNIVKILLRMTCEAFAKVHKERLWKASPELQDGSGERPLIVAYVFLWPHTKKKVFMGIPVVYRMYSATNETAAGYDDVDSQFKKF
ncbi:serine/threonine-protein phosphatase 6 regulatory ankyrin repeat subunit A-like isoform X1 [Mytilus trossulus]|uniref:serine/threonine-protein phosphatase 6 regulatory ankyrin repeat subunit A-like isoform X1 n=2 Tax=Mytilus trossulus TaxID=6551 RepID=UPI0030068BEB